MDNYWLVVSGADQVERLLELVSATRRGADSPTRLARQAKRIAPTGYRRRRRRLRGCESSSVERRPFKGYVYSLEVPGAAHVRHDRWTVTHNCFPKDSLALKQLAANSGYHFQLLTAVIEVNELQKRRVVQKLQKHLGRLRGKTIALLGLAFKPNTDDMREAPALVLASRLLAEGAEVRAWDPDRARRAARRVASRRLHSRRCAGADAAVIVTEWPELKRARVRGDRAPRWRTR